MGGTGGLDVVDLAAHRSSSLFCKPHTIVHKECTSLVYAMFLKWLKDGISAQ